MKFITAFLTAGALLAGCGSTDSATVQSVTSSPPAPPSRALAARVADARGTGVPNVDVVVHERTTNLKYVTVTGPDGHFAVDVPDGVYDLGLNLATDATCFYGPFTVPGAAAPADGGPA